MPINQLVRLMNMVKNLNMFPKERFGNIPIGFKYVPTELIIWDNDTNQWGIRNTDKRYENDAQKICDMLNELSEMLYAEQLRTIPLVLDTHISDEDFGKIERMITKHFNSYSKMHSINKINALQRENGRLQQRNPFNKVMLTRAINKKINDVITSTECGDVSRGCRLFAQNALLELKQELGI